MADASYAAQVTANGAVTPCDSFEQAMDLAQQAEGTATVTLLADVALDTSGYEMSQGTVVLQGGAHTLMTGTGLGLLISGGSLTTAELNVTGRQTGITLPPGSSGQLTISDGNIGMVEVYDGSLTVNGGEISLLSTRGGSTLLTGGHVEMIMSNGGKVERKGGTIESSGGDTPIAYPVDSVSATGDNRLSVGGGIQLTAVHTPNVAGGTYATSWSSGDESVATVDSNGRVIGAKPGTTVITITVNGTTGTFQVTVGAALTVDKTLLAELIEQARSVTLDDYTEESSAALSEALALAESVHGSVDATQEQVDAAAGSLQTKLNALVPKRKTISFTGTPQVRTTKTYDGSTLLYEGIVPENGYTGVADGDQVSVRVRADLDDAEPGDGKGYLVSYQLAGRDAGKYRLVDEGRHGSDGIVRKRPLAIQGLALESKTYDGDPYANVTSQGSLSNLVDADKGRIRLSAIASVRLDSADAGERLADVPFTVSLPDGMTATQFAGRYSFDEAKYDFSLIDFFGSTIPKVVVRNVPATIRKRALTVTVHDQSIREGEGVDGSAFTVEGLLDGHRISLRLKADGDSITAEDVEIVDGASTFTQNYDITTVDGMLTVHGMHTVTFDSMGGGKVKPIRVEDDGLAAEPTAPVRAGHTFQGWWTEETGGRQWDFAKDTVTGDMTLWARWKKNDVVPPTRPVYQGIQVTGKPDKLEYEAGDTFDPSGLKVGEYWSDGSTRTIDPDEYTVSGFDSSKPGEVTVTVTLKRDKRHTASFVIVVRAGRVDVHRLYNMGTGEHFYTANAVERDHLVAVGWRYEGVAFTMGTHGTPVHRLYAANGNRLHMYTTSKTELDTLLAAGWRYEGVAWHEPKDGGTKVHRLYNKRNGDHLHTVNPVERQALVKAGWRYEGVGLTAR